MLISLNRHYLFKKKIYCLDKICQLVLACLFTMYIETGFKIAPSQSYKYQNENILVRKCLSVLTLIFFASFSLNTETLQKQRSLRSETIFGNWKPLI